MTRESCAAAVDDEFPDETRWPTDAYVRPALLRYDPGEFAPRLAPPVPFDPFTFPLEYSPAVFAAFSAMLELSFGAINEIVETVDS